MKQIKLYRPSNGTDGDAFINHWCCNCARDKSMSEGKDFDDCSDDEVCKILSDTFLYDTADEQYPNAWCYSDIGEPICTEFIQIGQPIVIKDELTLDLFN